MDAGRGSYFCGLVLGIAVGVASTHVALSGRPGRPPARLSDLAIGSPVDGSPLVDLPPLETLVPELRTAFAPEPVTVHAIATSPIEAAASNAPAAEAPRKLPEMPDAEPLPPAKPREDAELRAFIRDELQTLAASEHEIWYETLHGLSRDDATEILRIWKLNRGTAGIHGLTGFQQLAALPAELLAPPTPPSAKKEVAPAKATTGDEHAAAIRKACEHNLANAATPGFKRWEVMIFEQPFSSQSTEDSIEPAVWINTTQGKHTVTHRPFDCAIQGTGFFKVRRGSETYLTRCGRFVRDEIGCLALRQSDGCCCPLEPEIKVPAECESLVIQPTGAVSAKITGASGLQPLGEVALYEVFDPSALKPAPDNLYAVTKESGPARALQLVEPGGLFQGSIEESNVDPAAERRKLDALDARRSTP